MSRESAQQEFSGWRNRAAIAAVTALALNSFSASSPQNPDEFPGVHEPVSSSEDNPTPPQKPLTVEKDKQTKPNIVLILADDLDNKLLPYMPNASSIGEMGASFTNYRVEQSTCCTSRSTILTGQYTHNTKVYGNDPPNGGFAKFQRTSEAHALPTWFDDDYQTWFQGKYLNHYPFNNQQNYVPPGWDNWAVPVEGGGYRQRNYKLNINGEVDSERRGHFLDKVLGKRLLSAVENDFADGGNFFEYSSFAPHGPFAHPKKYKAQFKDMTYPHQPNFDEADVSDKNRFVGEADRITDEQARIMDSKFRNRIRSVQVLDRNIGRLIQTLRSSGALDNTYLIFTSDNGYNMGEHRLRPGKYNQFEEALKVPLLISGPGISPGQTLNNLTGNIDLAPTIAAMAGTKPSIEPDGVSLLRLLEGRQTDLQRDYMLIGRGKIPLNRQVDSGLLEPPEPFVYRWRDAVDNDFHGVVSRRWKYIRFNRELDGEQAEELYDLRNDEFELTNLLGQDIEDVSARQKAVVLTMRNALDQLMRCDGAVECNIAR